MLIKQYGQTSPNINIEKSLEDSYWPIPKAVHLWVGPSSSASQAAEIAGEARSYSALL
jgi:hypothetical protein